MPTRTPSQVRITLPLPSLEELCHRWRIRELSLFGSVLREDFSAKSDVDVLVTFEPEARWTLLDFIGLREELSELFGREVDVVTQGGLRNPFRRHEILSTRQIVYAA